MLGVSLVIPAVVPAAGQETGRFRVIVRADNPIGKAERPEVVRMFLGQVTSWTDGTKVRAVDQSLASPVRKAFADAVLRQSILEVTHYWRQQLFAGRSAPPPVKGTDADVVAFVSATPGAIGYVSTTVTLPKEVKVLDISG